MSGMSEATGSGVRRAQGGEQTNISVLLSLPHLRFVTNNHAESFWIKLKFACGKFLPHLSGAAGDHSVRRWRTPLSTLSGFAAGETGDHSSLSTLSGFAAGETGDHSFLITLQVYRLYQFRRRRSRAFRACRSRGSRGSLCVLSHSRNRARSTDLRCSRPFSSERRRVG